MRIGLITFICSGVTASSFEASSSIIGHTDVSPTVLVEGGVYELSLGVNPITASAVAEESDGDLEDVAEFSFIGDQVPLFEESFKDNIAASTANEILEQGSAKSLGGLIAMPSHVSVQPTF